MTGYPLDSAVFRSSVTSGSACATSGTRDTSASKKQDTTATTARDIYFIGDYFHGSGDTSEQRSSYGIRAADPRPEASRYLIVIQIPVF